ncbi:hypothetical protein OHA18_26525 [Kribbella sp. NBC_00709]|uniref:hypothetical protein n=1 Tax=Kribbella sp. NBC_00709 TaxID=2975972 RepID=UPI002E285BD5|nr:hypothetical protein [Kribbella sp. NBC_00709]
MKRILVRAALAASFAVTALGVGGAADAASAAPVHEDNATQDSMASVGIAADTAWATGPRAGDGTGDGAWRAYGNTNPITSSSSTWRCTKSVGAGWNINAQLCAVRSAFSAGAQAAVIVRNNSGDLVSAEAYAELWDDPHGEEIASWACGKSGVAANSWSVCFGHTVPYAFPVFAWQGNVTALGGTRYFEDRTPTV